MHLSLKQTPDGQIFRGPHMLDPKCCAWRPATDQKGQPVEALEAVAHAQLRPFLHRLVIGVIGPREATPDQLRAAEAVGVLLGDLGVTLICGGRSGVMEAVCKGCSDAGGRPVGILPGTDPTEANPYVALPLPTGLSEARNIVIARAARALIAVGNSPGTLTEVAFGLHFGKPVIGVEGAASLKGVRQAADARDAVAQGLAAVLDALPVIGAEQ